MFSAVLYECLTTWCLLLPFLAVSSIVVGGIAPPANCSLAAGVVDNMFVKN